jgi:hypothetical protein
MITINVNIKLLILSLWLPASAVASCPDSTETVQNKKAVAEKFVTMYKGTLFCADCPGIRTELKMNSHTLQYEETMFYPERNTTVRFAGSCNTERGYGKDRNAVVYVLDDDKPGNERRFLKLNDTTLLMLGASEEIIDTTSFYKLYKVK